MKSCWVPRSLTLLEREVGPDHMLDTIRYEGTKEGWDALEAASNAHSEGFFGTHVSCGCTKN